MDDPSSNNTLPDLGHHRHNLSSSGVSPLEQEVLDEYERLARNMEKVGYSSSTSTMSAFFWDPGRVLVFKSYSL